MILRTREHSYDERLNYFTPEQMDEHDITLGSYNNSMNFIFGLSGGDIDENFDILNNPYVSYHGFERKGGRTFYPKYEFEVCKDDHLSLFLKENQYDWYA